MPTQRLLRAQPGDELLAAHINQAADALDRQRLVGGDGVLVTDTPTGQVIGIEREIKFWANFSAVGTPVSTNGPVPYAWKEQIPQPDGTWFDGPWSGTLADNPAYEINGNASVAIDGNTRAFVRMGQGSNTFFFELGSCP